MFARGRMSIGVDHAAGRNAAPLGAKGLVAGQHVPDCVGEPAGDVDLGDLGAALLAEPPLVALVALGVGEVLERVQVASISAQRR